MAKRKDMKNLLDRNGWFHFRGFFPKDLIAVGYPKEMPVSLDTRDYAIAIERRTEYLAGHKNGSQKNVHVGMDNTLFYKTCLMSRYLA